MRLFVALHLETELAHSVAELQAGLRREDVEGRVRWVDPGGLHLTLQFLGEVPVGRVDGLSRALAGVVEGRPAPQLGLSGLGAFPSLGRPRVLWVGLGEEGQALEPLRRAVESATEPLGWPQERRAFQPHLTLGRTKEGPGGAPLRLGPRLLAALSRGTAGGTAAAPQRRVALVQSHLSRAGSRYEDVATWTLAAP